LKNSRSIITSNIIKIKAKINYAYIFALTQGVHLKARGNRIIVITSMQNSLQIFILLLMVVLNGLTRHAHKNENKLRSRSKISIVKISYSKAMRKEQKIILL